MITPLVSVCVQTYQHVRFIRECLDGILMQQTDFSFEILLGEDCSTDGTREICVEYAEKYPEKIRLFLHSRDTNISINGKPSGRFNFINNLRNATGKYIALCEGDDFWTSPHKLQDQVNFLEKNTEVSLCHHDMQVIKNGVEILEYRIAENKDVTTLLDLGRENYIYTSSAVFRNYFQTEFPKIFYQVSTGDYLLFLTVAENGDIKYLNEKMGIYHIHEGGVWSMLEDKVRIASHIVTLDLLLEYYKADAKLKSALQEQKTYQILQLLGAEDSIRIVIEDNVGGILASSSGRDIHQYVNRILKMNAQMNRVIMHPVVRLFSGIHRLVKKDKSFGRIGD